MRNMSLPDGHWFCIALVKNHNSVANQNQLIIPKVYHNFSIKPWIFNNLQNFFWASLDVLAVYHRPISQLHIPPGRVAF